MSEPVFDTWIERDVALDDGTVVPQVRHGWVRVGAFTPARDNVVVVLHALTGNARVHEWWRALVSSGAALDPSRCAIIAPDLLGSCGVTRCETADGAAHRAAHRAALTPRDLARRVWALCDALGVERPLAMIGGSLGGMVALECAALAPGRARRTVVLAAPARQTAVGAAWGALMRTALETGGPDAGLALARAIGMLSYRGTRGLEARFGAADTVRDVTDGVGAWLAHHGRALVARFDAYAYRTLIDAMDRHDVRRDRGPLADALGDAADRVLGVGIPGDLLYPDDVVASWCRATGARYATIDSPHGHDAFLLETDAVDALIGRELDAARGEAAEEAYVTADHATRGDVVRGDAVRGEARPGEAARREANAPSPAIHTRPGGARIALAGVGTVGDAFAARLAAAGRDAPGTLVRALVRDPSRAPAGLTACRDAGVAAQDVLTTEPEQLLADDPDVLVEAVGGLAPSYDLVRAALARGIRVVTANKTLVAAHGPSLLQLARTYETTFDFEAAVAASVPVVRLLRERRDVPPVAAVTGILNGTVNTVLDALHEGWGLHDAIADAQARGFAEADPSRDLDGRDAEDKLRILAWLAFGTAPTALTVPRRGVDEEIARLVRRVRRDGRTVRLLAEARADGTARIAPHVVACDDAWGRVRGATNRVAIDDVLGGRLVLVGPGAGGAPTAAALWRDLLRPARDRRDYGVSPGTDTADPDALASAVPASRTVTSSAAVSMRPARLTCTSSR